MAGVVAAVAAITLVALSLAGGDDQPVSTGTTTTTWTTTITTTTAVTTTTTMVAERVTSTTTTTTTTTVPSTTTSSSAATTVATVAAWIQDQLDEEYTQPDPVHGILGPWQIRCSETGEIAVGGVFVCDVVPNERNTVAWESGTAVIYVLDATGRAAWSTASDNPATTAALRSTYDRTPHGLLCRELMTPDVAPHPFDLSTTTPENAYFWALVYWSLEGEPDRMDADGNGVPCETLFEPEVVATVLARGRA